MRSTVIGLWFLLLIVCVFRFIDSFIAIEPYMVLLFAIRYATRRGTKTVQTNCIHLYTVGKPEGRAIFS